MSLVLRRPVRLTRNLLRETYKVFRRFPFRVRQLISIRLLGATHVGRRATGRKTFAEDHALFKKTFDDSPAALKAFRNEMLAHRLFSDRPWMPPVLAQGERWFAIPYFPDETRLDRIAPALSSSTRREIARQAMSILFDIFLQGYAHRDFHGKNLFWVDGQLYVIDFESLAAYPEEPRSAFPLSYDIIGAGLDSPYHTGQMCYCRSNSATALERLLRVPFADALEQLQRDLKNELRKASLAFKTKDARHICKAQRIYGSFTLPHLSVSKEEAQRHSARRLERFGVTAAVLRGKSLLDLGSSVGAMTFESQKFQPGRCVGVEYDDEKVTVANKVAAYNGLNNVHFLHADIDQLTVDDVSGSFDLVYCLAISEHVANKNRLFRLLGETTRQLVFFEGNATTDPRDVETKLFKSGFREVRVLGISDDDCRAENNRRPLLVGFK